MDILQGGAMAISALLAVVAALSFARRDSDSGSGRWLALFLILATSWGVVVNLQNPAAGSEHNLWVVRLTFVSAILMVYAMYRFSIAITNTANWRRKYGALLPTGLLSVLALTPWMVSSVRVDGGTVEAVREPLYYVVAGFMVVMALVSIYVVWRGYLNETNARRQHQYAVIIAGLTIGTLLAAVTNIALPNVMNTIEPARYAWVSLLIWTCVLAYAVVRHQFLDVRLAVVRSVAYTMSTASLAGIYLLAVVVLSGWLLGDNVQFSETLFYIAIALVVVVLFQPVRHFFDKLTSRIFYRDNYNEEDFFSRFTRKLDTSLDLKRLLSKAARELLNTLNSEYVSFFVYENDWSVSVGVPSHSKLRMSDARAISSLLGDRESAVLIDELDNDRQLRRLMISHRIAIILPLFRKDEVLGYALLGEHRGRLYTKRDLRLLDTVSGELSIAIQNAIAVQEVKDLNETLQQRIDAATEELRRSNSELQRLDEAKDEFISMASHQLRTPLTSVKGYISMVLDGDVGKVSAAQKKLLSEAFVSSDRMVHLINDFLNVSRLQTGKFMLDRRPTDISKLVKQEVESLKATAKSRDLELVYEGPAESPKLYVDDGKLRQVVMNFIDNAMYYSKEHNKVRIKLVVSKADVTLTVKDKGIGVPKSEQERLFSKFFRASNARKQRPDGTGVGLFLAKRVIHEHGGQIIFKSKENQGSTFGFSLPIKRLSLAPRDDSD